MVRGRVEQGLAPGITVGTLSLGLLARLDPRIRLTAMPLQREEKGIG